MITFEKWLHTNHPEILRETVLKNIASRVGLQNVKLLGKSRLDKNGKILVKYEGDYGEGARIPGWIPIEYLTDEERELHQQMSDNEPIPYTSQHEKNLKLYGKHEGWMQNTIYKGVVGASLLGLTGCDGDKCTPKPNIQQQQPSEFQKIFHPSWKKDLRRKSQQLKDQGKNHGMFRHGELQPDSNKTSVTSQDAGDFL